MAKFIIKYTDGKPKFLVSLDQLKRMNHIFLIRSPTQAVPSHYRCCTGKTGEETRFSHYDSGEAGYKELKLLFDPTRKEFEVNYEDQAPIVIKAEWLTQQPEAALKAIYRTINIPGDERMLSWKSRCVEEFSKWPGFHRDAEISTGFKDISIAKSDHELLPNIVQEAIAENTIYEYLKGFVSKI
jgi:hypothetical protein